MHNDIYHLRRDTYYSRSDDTSATILSCGKPLPHSGQIWYRGYYWMNTDWKAKSFKHKAQGKGENSTGSCNEWEPLFVGKVTSVQNLLHFHLVSKSGSIPIHQCAPPPAPAPGLAQWTLVPFFPQGYKSSRMFTFGEDTKAASTCIAMDSLQTRGLVSSNYFGSS